LISTRFQRTSKWLETFAITAVVLFAGYFLHHQDPFFVHAPFPWVWFAPLLVALRYGISPGIISLTLVCVVYLTGQRLGRVPLGFPTSFFLGGVLITLLCGQFSNVWHQRLRRAEQLSRHASERFEQLSRSYFMVRLSHNRLEENLISRPVTLRDAMTDLRSLIAAHNGKVNQDTGAALISLLAQYCCIESAAIYLTDREGRLQEKPIVGCGKGAPYHPNDLLLRSAIEKQKTAFQAVNRLRGDEESAYLVAAPMCTSSGVLMGVLLVSEMPFLSMNRENLQIMGILLAYATDHAESASIAQTLLEGFPECPSEFAAEMVKMVHLRRDLDVKSALVLVNIAPNVHLEAICTALERQQRGLDHGWRRDLNWGVQYLTLLPFSGLAAVEGYLDRINDILHRQFGLHAGEGGISTNSTLLTTDDPLVQLNELLGIPPRTLSQKQHARHVQPQIRKPWNLQE
jgi:hypothetical protein